jgi:hypothetical protein
MNFIYNFLHRVVQKLGIQMMLAKEKYIGAIIACSSLTGAQENWNLILMTVKHGSQNIIHK